MGESPAIRRGFFYALFSVKLIGKINQRIKDKPFFKIR